MIPTRHQATRNFGYITLAHQIQKTDTGTEEARPDVRVVSCLVKMTLDCPFQLTRESPSQLADLLGWPHLLQLLLY